MERAPEEQQRAPAHMEALQQQSTELGKAALMGSREHGRRPAVSPLLLLKQLEELKRQKFTLENKVRAGELSVEDFSPEKLTKEYMTEGIATLEKEIEKLKVTNHNQSLVLRRLQLYDAIHNKLLEKNTESQFIYETMEHSMGLCRRIIKSQKCPPPSCSSYTQGLGCVPRSWLCPPMNTTRKRFYELKETCTELMMELRSMKKNEHNFAQMDNQNFRKINAYVAKEIDIVTVVQNVFQRLILGSRVNWAEDPKLKEIVLKLGQNPACF